MARYTRTESIDSEGSQAGRVLDYGAGVMWFPRRMMDGGHLEAGLLYRDDKIRWIESDEERSRNDWQFYGLRALAGWCWRGDMIFVDLAIGAAKGIARGKRDFAGWSWEPEAYLRVGFAFDFRS